MTASSTANHNPNEPPPKPIISPPNTLTLSQIVTGCKVYVQRPVQRDVPVEEVRKAEILSIRERKLGRSERRERKQRMKQGESTEHASDTADSTAQGLDRLEYYIHYVEFNKRLDEWIPAARILLSKEVEWPIPPAPAPSTSTSTSHNQKDSRKQSRESSLVAGQAPPSPGGSTEIKKAAEASQLLRKAAIKAAATQASTGGAAGTSKKRKLSAGTDGVPGTPDADDEDDGDAEDADGDAEMKAGGGKDKGSDDAASAADGGEGGTFSKSQEIEKLRTQGSMTQSHSEVSRVKNLDRIQIGRHLVEAWYFSPYPVEYAHTPILYVCEFCLGFWASEKQIERHRTKCTLRHPPGNEIYRHEEISFFEIDGRKQKTWCRNLCLLSKAFLDHKTLYYDVDPFLYYVMVSRDETGCHLIGYFSKEKECAENYNVACILTLPQYQRMSYGKLLIEFSYELSKKEQKLGSPEKPLSDLGLLSYRAYWAEIIVDLLINTKDDITIDEIANRTAIVHADIMHTCQVLQLLKFSQGQHHLAVSPAVLEQHERVKAKTRRRIDPSKLIWKPPVFSRQELRFGF
ncbi:NuA4 histone acetyltransferase complex catalytic subunit ESA1 [Sporobolomyces koalae]|uniref:NuA4 histone acetyltransferase complex catalytic subunit ESA1 n=1 Tax=Sporobolomyces koalae TaxID=500713 RepID=UPI00316E8063